MSATAREHNADLGDLGTPAGVEALTSAHAQARQRADDGDLTGARTMLEDALVAGELRLGRDHPRLVPLMLDLSTIAQNVGNLTEAQNQLRRAYGIAVAANGPEHASSVSIEGRLATVCDRLGEPTDAYDWHITEVGPRVLGPDHPAVRGAQKRLATAPPPPPVPAEPESGGWAPASYEDDELGYASTYTPAPRTPGVYQRRSTEFAEAPHDETYEEEWEQPGLAIYPARSRRGNTAGIVVVASLGLAVIVAAAVIAVQLFGSSSRGRSPTIPDSSTGAQAATAEPTPTGRPPTGVTLVDNGGSVTLTWSDPSDGNVAFIVAGGRSGTTSAPLETVPAGRTTSTIYGLNAGYDYCYTVAAVWSSEQIETSAEVCTKRSSTSTEPKLSTGAAPSVPITA